MTDMNNTIKLPEPAGVVGVMPGTSGFTTAIFKANEVPVGTHLYTEQQVRDLLVFGQDVETSVSAQRVTQAADHIERPRNGGRASRSPESRKCLAPQKR